jgi:hypothetical protein
LTALNEVYLRAHPQTPSIYEAGVYYQREGKTPDGRQKEKWLTVPVMLLIRSRVGFDCEDLACWRAAELRVRGIPAIAFARPSSVGFHILVRYPDGRTEDPSRKLGMGAES